MVVGTTLGGRYRLEERIAVGGMGSVYAAHDERLRRRVAVKIMRDDLAGDESFVERFRREARAAGALSHPSVAAVFDYGEDGGHHYIVMEYVEGRDLARLLREEGRLELSRAEQIGIQICRALDHAHAAGVVHRDVKPANVMVGSNDVVKVTDFGIARGLNDSTLTATGSIMGSAQYMSPEQATGESVGPHSDVYAAGIVLYEILTGTVPFTGESAVAVAMRHATERVPRPSAVDPGIPSHLDDAVARATEKDPARRPSAAALAAALGETIDPTPPVVTGPVLEPDATERLPLPLPVTRWDPERLGRIVLVTFAVLLVVAAALLIYRVVADEDDSTRRTRGGAAGAVTTPAETETGSTQSAEATPPAEPAEYVIEDELLGQDKNDARDYLRELGFEVSFQHVDDLAEKHSVVGVIPPPGTSVSEGRAITLLISTGRSPDDGEEDGD